MQAERKLQYKVGFFIAIGLIAVMGSILLLGGDKLLFTKNIEIKTRFIDVQGLFAGSVVSLSGMSVGNVREIRFVENENSLEVVMDVNRNYQNRLLEGTNAEVRTQGALGDKYVYLSPGKPGSPVIKDGATIPGVDSDFMKLLTSREDGVARVIDLIKELHIMVSTFNSAGRTDTMMKNFTEASFKLNSTLSRLDSLLGDISGTTPKDKRLGAAVVSLANVLEKIDQGKGTLGQLINDPSLHSSLKAYLGGSPRDTYMKNMIRETIQKSDGAGR